MSCDATNLLCAQSIMANVKYTRGMEVVSGSRDDRCNQGLCWCVVDHWQQDTILFLGNWSPSLPASSLLLKEKCLRTGDFSHETINLCLWYCLISVVGLDLTSPCENYDCFQLKTRMQMMMKKNFLCTFKQMLQLCIILLSMLEANGLRVYYPLIRTIFQERSWFMCSLKRLNGALTSSLANPELENANVITVILQVMETTQKRGFSSKGSNQLHISRSPITSPCSFIKHFQHTSHLAGNIF